MLNKKKLIRTGKGVFYSFVMMAISSLIIYFILSAQAGNISPASPVGSTMKSMDEIYLILSGNYDSSGVSGKSDGNVSEILKCITDKMNNIACN